MPASTMFILIANTLLILGGGILVSMLLIIQRQFNSLPSKEIRSKKYFLIAPVLFLVLAYFGYLVTFWSAHKSWHDLVMPGALLLFASALWVTYKLSVQPLISFALEQGNITDSLTGIYNRRHLERRLTEEIVRAQRYSTPLSVFLLEVDQFERMNSAYGKRSGDQILVHLSRLLLEYVRESDEVARYNKGEILVMAPNTSIHDTHLLAERIRQRVELQPLLHAESEQIERIAIRISIGVATLQGGFDSLDKLLQRAEVALQQAQQAGGNCVVASDASVIQ